MMLSIPEFAKRAGVSAQAVRQAIDSRRVKPSKDKKGKVVLEWESQAPRFMATSSKFVPAASEDDGDGTGPAMSLQTATLQQARFKAMQAELDFKKESGELIERARVEKEWESIALAVQKAVLSIPARVAAVVAAETDRHAVERILITEFKQSLTALAGNVRSPDAHSAAA